jgi:hypothetical protein
VSRSAAFSLPLGTAAVLLILVISGCASQPRFPQAALRLPESSLAIRSAQSRTFPANSEAEILGASVAVLQDMEFNLDEMSGALGVLSASKVVDADSTPEKTGLLMLDVLCVLGGGGNCAAMSSASDEQKILLTLVVLPSLNRAGDYTARVTLQRAVFDKESRVKVSEQIDDPAVYQEIFANLAKSIALQEMQ